MRPAWLRGKRRWIVTAGLAVLSVAFLLFLLSVVWQWPKRAPFQAVRWDASRPQVKVDGEWYELLAIDDVASEKIIASCMRRHGDGWRKRFSEDLVEILAGMWRWPGGTVDLSVRRLDDGRTATLRSVPMTNASRQSVWRHNVRAEWLEPLWTAGVEADLEEFERILRERYSYLELKGVDWQGALAAIKERAALGLNRADLALELGSLIARFGDGHSRIQSPRQDMALEGFAPFLVDQAEGKLVAFKEDRTAFIERDFPFVKEMDGLPIERWIDAARSLVQSGSPQFVLRQAVRELRSVGELRTKLGLPEASTVAVRLESQNGNTRAVNLALSDRRGLFGEWPRTRTRLLEGGIGYLRIQEMTDDGGFIGSLHSAMRDFRGGRGLVIDVRENGGGTRDVLRELFPYFMRAGDAPRIANVAAYRLPPQERPGNPEGYLSNRYLFPLTWPGWSAGERAAVERFAASFRPQWTPPAGAFTDWHFMVISPKSGVPYFHYEKPLIVLMDAGCFSATDIFLGAFKGWRNVTLMGKSSGGGSGRVAEYKLPASKLDVRLSTMASFQPDGRLYDGVGVEPDVSVEPLATDLIGETDSVLDAAIRRLEAEAPP